MTSFLDGIHLVRLLSILTYGYWGWGASISITAFLNGIDFTQLLYISTCM